jgi:hypothetical protein
MTASVPMMLPAPPRLSMMICWPMISAIFGMKIRPMMSVLPPAANGITILMVLAG